MDNSLKLFIKTENRIREKTCKIHKEKDFIAYIHKTSKDYRQGNGIFIKNRGGKSLNDWEKIFSKFFDIKNYCHKTFTFFDSYDLKSLRIEANQAKYQEVNVFPVAICYDSPFKNRSLLLNPVISKIRSEDDWEHYRKFVAELHSDNDWICHKVFDILKDTSEAVNIERFFIPEEESKKILSILGIFKCGNIARIENMETHPKFRRRGLASRLLIFALQYALKELKVKGLVLTCANNEAAQGLYNKFGFKTVGSKVELINYC